ncbi:MAG: hypothetical protein Q4P18_07315 [Methanobrevibacter sp.]|uniref:hypothetical protein n=1 Tax=Methanobrevibacter sp. TaxID=66852 RepID=UPI0026E0BE52|nr:hypothetical protein [Methanobrevibacter sp.]MDO5849327.1 hypothetical protein [Methanobrevibacter sp.]
MRIGSNLLNWLKSKTYLKDEVDSKISQIASAKLSRLVVEELPSTGENNIIYLVPNESGDDPYTEYLYDENGWNIIGSTQVDLSDYYRESEVDGLLDGKSNVGHSHNASTIIYGDSNLQTVVDGKADNTAVTGSKNGLMSKEDKIKLDSVSSDADKVEFIQIKNEGERIGTIKINGTSFDLYASLPEEAVEYSKATSSSDGLMSKEDKAKLDNISDYANEVSYSGALTGQWIGTITIDNVNKSIYVPDFTFAPYNHSHDNYYTKTQADTLLNGKAGTGVATDESNGLMSSYDKGKLDSMSAVELTVVDFDNNETTYNLVVLEGD